MSEERVARLLERLRDPKMEAFDVGASRVEWSLKDERLLEDAANEIERLHAENTRMRAALTEIRDMVKSHSLYEPLTVEQEIEVGGDIGTFSALARVADEGLGQDG